MNQRFRSGWIVLSLIVVFGLLLAACAPAATTPTTAPVAPPPAEPTKAPEPTTAPQPTTAPAPTEPPAATGPFKCEAPIKIGVVGDYSGPLAVYGAMQKRSFLLGMEYMAGAAGTADNVFKFGDCAVQVFFADDKGVPDTTAAVAKELIEVQKVDMLVGSVSSPSTATLQGLAKDNKKVLVVNPAAANDITGVNFNEYTFRTSRNNYQDFINLCQYLTTKYKTFVQIAPDNIFGRGGATSARDACTKFGGEFVADDIYAPLDTTEFTPYMEQILNSGAQAWIATWAGGGFVPMFKAAQDVGVTEKMGMGSSIANNATVPVFYAPMIGQNSGILYHYTLPNNPINDWLVKEVKARYHEPPDLFDADGMNAAIMIIEGLKKTGGSTAADQLIKAFEGLEFDGPKGKVYIRPEDHVAIQDMYIVKILNVDDPEFKFFELVSTTRPEPPCLLPEALKARCGSLPYGSLSGQ
jgi:branched-chain amino acid transport system substrate-binding protein